MLRWRYERMNFQVSISLFSPRGNDENPEWICNYSHHHHHHRRRRRHFGSLEITRNFNTSSWTKTSLSLALNCQISTERMRIPSRGKTITIMKLCIRLSYMVKLSLGVVELLKLEQIENEAQQVYVVKKILMLNIWFLCMELNANKIVTYFYGSSFLLPYNLFSSPLYSTKYTVHTFEISLVHIFSHHVHDVVNIWCEVKAWTSVTYPFYLSPAIPLCLHTIHITTREWNGEGEKT
jgi:hypothetical protein